MFSQLLGLEQPDEYSNPNDHDNSIAFAGVDVSYINPQDYVAAGENANQTISVLQESVIDYCKAKTEGYQYVYSLANMMFDGNTIGIIGYVVGYKKDVDSEECNVFDISTIIFERDQDFFMNNRDELYHKLSHKFNYLTSDFLIDVNVDGGK